MKERDPIVSSGFEQEETKPAVDPTGAEEKKKNSISLTLPEPGSRFKWAVVAVGILIILLTIPLLSTCGGANVANDETKNKKDTQKSSPSATTSELSQEELEKFKKETKEEVQEEIRSFIQQWKDSLSKQNSEPQQVSQPVDLEKVKSEIKEELRLELQSLLKDLKARQTTPLETLRDYVPRHPVVPSHKARVPAKYKAPTVVIPPADEVVEVPTQVGPPSEPLKVKDENRMKEEELVRQMFDMESPVDERVSATKQLANHRYYRVARALSFVLQRDAEPSLRATAAQSMGEVANSTFLPMLEAASVKDKSPEVQEAAKTAASKIAARVAANQDF